MRVAGATRAARTEFGLAAGGDHFRNAANDAGLAAAIGPGNEHGVEPILRVEGVSYVGAPEANSRDPPITPFRGEGVVSVDGLVRPMKRAHAKMNDPGSGLRPRRMGGAAHTRWHLVRTARLSRSVITPTRNGDGSGQQ